MDKVPEITAKNVIVTDNELKVQLADNRTFAVPIAWYPRLVHGTKEERNNCVFIAGGIGIHWPDSDEDISVEGVILGKPSYESQKSFGKWLKSRAKKRR